MFTNSILKTIFVSSVISPCTLWLKVVRLCVKHIAGKNTATPVFNHGGHRKGTKNTEVLRVWRIRVNDTSYKNSYFCGLKFTYLCRVKKTGFFIPILILAIYSCRNDLKLT